MLLIILLVALWALFKFDVTLPAGYDLPRLSAHDLEVLNFAAGAQGTDCPLLL